MHRINIVFGPVGTMFTFLYKTEEGARKALVDGVVVNDESKFLIADDFGQSGEFARPSIHALMLEDMEQSGAASIEIGLHNARTQAKGNQLAEQDPKLRTAAMMRGNGLFMGGHPGPVPRQ